MTTAAPTLAPGVYPNLSIEEYLAIRAMSGSRLEKFRRSPLQYRHSLSEPQRKTDALERGTALHLALLEPALFQTRYVVAEPCAVLLKSGARKGEPCGNPGLFLLREIGWACGQHVKGWGSSIDESAETISAENHAKVLGMAKAVSDHPLARTLFEGRGDFEVTIVFEDPATGVLCKVRPDRLVERAGMHVALKSTRDAAPWAFPRQAEALGYFRSLALYRRGLKAVGWPYSYTTVLAVEPESPFDLECYLADEGRAEGSLETADVEVTRLLSDFAACSQEDSWPGYNRGQFRTLARPRWASGSREED